MLIEEKLTTLALNSPLSETTATLPRSCFEALTSNPSMESGIYEIDPDGSNVGDDPIAVFCNATTGKKNLYFFNSTKNCEVKGPFRLDVF